MKPLKAEQLRELQKQKPYEFGVSHHDISFSEKDNMVWCVLDAPNKEAIEKHHAKAKIKPDLIYEVESTRKSTTPP